LNQTELKKQWAAWQSRLEEAVQSARQLERRWGIIRHTKLEAWQNIKQQFSQDNPFSSEDQRLKQEVDEKIAFWGKKPGFGIITVNALPFAEVVIDGIMRGEVPPERQFRLEDGYHEVILKMGIRTFRKEILILEGKSETIRHQFK
jgi:hypothetical protein